MKVLVLGGYGNFGRLIARSLAGEKSIELVVAGRDLARARAFAAELSCAALRIDAGDPALARHLANESIGLVISTAGPFQGQDYAVARAAIAARAHYVDIADGRDFVCGIGALDPQARASAVLVAAGASSVPALSTAVVDRFAPEFAALDTIDLGICTSSRYPGEATVEAILGYCGRPIPRWQEGRSGVSFGWQQLRRHRFRLAPVSRWICDCDVPELGIFPTRFPGVRDVRFGAGIAPAFAHLGLWALSSFVRLGIVPDLRRHAGLLVRVGRKLETDSGQSAMFVRLSGTGRDGRAQVRRWELVAEGNEGANIPCMAAVRLARKLAAGSIAQRGAFPCVGLITLEEYLDELRPFKVRWQAFDA